MNKKPYRRHVRTANVDPCDQLHLLLMEHACQAHKAPPDDIGGFTGFVGRSPAPSSLQGGT